MTPFATLGIVRAVTALVGAAILVVGVRAYWTTGRRSLLLFAAGMGLASAGYFLEGVLVEVAGWSLPRATLLESVFSLAAFSLLAASVWFRDSARPRRPRAPPPARRPTTR